jgi:hypothetical protein
MLADAFLVVTIAAQRRADTAATTLIVYALIRARFELLSRADTANHIDAVENSNQNEVSARISV